MPQGIGPIGIYHSHPVSSRLFHSHTDDNTLVSLTNQFQNCVSIVTNGEGVNFYQMGKENKTREITAEFDEPEVSDFILVTIDENFYAQISNSIYKDSNKTDYIKMRINNKLIEGFQNFWNEIDLSKKNSKISEEVKVDEFLTNDITEEPIYLKIPSETKHNISKLLIIQNQTAEENEINDYTNLNIRIKIKFLIYVIDHDRKLYNFKNAIRVEFLGNILPYKLQYSILDSTSSNLIIPKDYFLDYFGFFMRLSSYQEKELNELALSKSNYEFLSKILSSFDSFTKIEISKKLKAHLTKFINNLENFSINYDWGENLKKKIELLRINLSKNVIYLGNNS